MGCRANAHEYSQEPNIFVSATNCGDTKKTQGGCFGVILYPIRNPSEANHISFCNSVKFNAEKA
jgi:hypothetical protein